MSTLVHNGKLHKRWVPQNSQWLHNNVVYCDTVHLNEIKCFESVTDAIYVANMALPCAISHPNHFHLQTLLSP